MPDTKLIDGKAHAAALRQRIAGHVAEMKKNHGVTPGLAVVLVGNDPASEVYVRNKGKQTVEVGMASFEHKLPANTSEADLLKLVKSLNDDKSVDGILVQFPVPEQISQTRVINTIDPAKDVDGLNPINAGRLWSGEAALVPCTPYGCVVLLKEELGNLAGKEALVMGRSNLVGKPIAGLLLNENCTVTLAHSRTRDLAGVARRADILIAAIGKPEMVKGAWIKPGATVIDVGINRIDLPDGKTRLLGDVAFKEAQGIAGAITPVPGGVGPMTIACLLRNTLVAACRRRNLPAPAI
ncbi:MAG TPA: bifunctional methylenetetrahydrofolate dehydrogenase/methenyltetrahydrofolate cyclohydrolase FolD [Stellaceae bacterium]|nr:bifunctional methylenetetrahydrofolate dehydrogenase/methenyltetrahydrofolate cyclohydrolase FolD [Stellaceae bacterium]